MTDMVALRDHFLDLLSRHVHKLAVRGQRATGLAPCHDDHTPSFSADLSRGVWYCHTCGRGGGVKDFALMVGEPWGSTCRENRATRARRARFQAERQARAILERRAEERDLTLCAEHRELHGEALAAADLLALFHRRLDLATEFAALLARTESEYGAALFRLSVLAARLDGELT